MTKETEKLLTAFEEYLENKTDAEAGGVPSGPARWEGIGKQFEQLGILLEKAIDARINQRFSDDGK